MKIKNIVLVLVATLSVLLLPVTVDASEYTCSCKGDYYTYYGLEKFENNVTTYNFAVCHDSTLSSCSSYRLYRALDCYEQYFIRIKLTDTDSLGHLCYATIFISDGNYVDVYNSSGGTDWKTSNDYSSNMRGRSNSKYYFLHVFRTYHTIESFSTPVDFEIECLESSRDELLRELSKYLCGESTDLPTNVKVVTKKVKDLEAPLNITVNGIDNNIFETKSKSVKIRWEQSNIDLTGYKTVFYMRESGRCRKTIFNEWQDVKTPWLFDKDYVTAKYCNNNLKYHEYKWWTDQSKLGDYANAKLYGDETGGLMCEHAAVDFMIRNEKEDEEGTLHYSSWVYVNCFEDGTYQIYEMNEDYTLDEDPDETGNINTDSTIYDDETVYDEDDVDASLGIGDAKDFVGGMTDLINSLRSFPALFSKIFSFFPSWVLAMIGMLFIAALVSRIFL